MGKWVAGVDVGGTNIVCGLVDRATGKVAAKLKRPTERDGGSDHVLDRIANAVRDLLSEQGLSVQDVDAVGLGVPGINDPERGVVILASNLKWENVPVAQKLSERLGVPVTVDNDVRMYTYGEAAVGAGAPYDHVMGLTIGTGMAAAFVNHGKLHYGSRNQAGEIGHIVMEGIPYACGCGLTGCLETVVSATGIVRVAEELIKQGRSSSLKPGQFQSADVSKAYDEGDEVARETFHKVGGYLARGLASVIPATAPDVVVIGGGGALAGERLFAPMREQLKGILHPMYLDHLQILPAKYNDDAGVIGSAMYAGSRYA